MSLYKFLYKKNKSTFKGLSCKNYIMMKRLIYVMVLPLLFISMHLSAQDRLVTGRVTDANGAPVANASVTVKGGTKVVHKLLLMVHFNSGFLQLLL